MTIVAELKPTGPAATQEAGVELLRTFTLIGGLASGALHRLWLGGSPVVGRTVGQRQIWRLSAFNLTCAVLALSP